MIRTTEMRQYFINSQISSYILFVVFSCNEEEKHFSYSHGAIVRGDTTTKEIALVFTGDEFGDGGSFISETLKKKTSTLHFS